MCDLEKRKGLSEGNEVAHAGLYGSEATSGGVEDGAEEDDTPEDGIVEVVGEKIDLCLSRLVVRFLGWRGHCGRSGTTGASPRERLECFS